MGGGDWQPDFGNFQALDPSQLLGFTPEFVKEYAEKVKLYKMPGISRIYGCDPVHKDTDGFACSVLTKQQIESVQPDDTVQCKVYNGRKN